MITNRPPSEAVASPSAGKKRSVSGSSWSTSPASPPISGRSSANHASATDPIMAKVNWAASVTTMPVRPESSEYTPTNTISRPTVAMAAVISRPNSENEVWPNRASPGNSTPITDSIASTTHPMMAAFMNRPK